MSTAVQITHVYLEVEAADGIETLYTQHIMTKVFVLFVFFMPRSVPL